MPTEENNSPVVTPRFYPTLSSVIDESQIPEVLGFIKEGVTFLLEKVHFKDLQYNKSPKGDAAFYSLSIVSKNRLDIEIPGTGIYLVLNPDIIGGDSNISSFPISIDYEWKILAYLRSFDLDQFDFSPRSFFEIALQILNISEEQAVSNFINIFTESTDENVSSLQKFVSDLNTSSSINIPTPDNNTRLSKVIEDIYTETGEYASIISFATYIIGNDLETTKKKLKAYFRTLFPEDIEDYVKDILIPKFRATLLLTAGIEFPRNMLKPVYPEGHENALEVIPEDPSDEFLDNVLLSFGEVLFYADTEEGFGYSMDLVLNTSTPAMLGNTGLIINIDNLKIDLSKKRNIIEADLDGRPPDFMGVYTEQTDIILPKKWFKEEAGQTLAITGKHLLIGTGGISGKVALRSTVIGDTNDTFWCNIGSQNGFRLGFKSFDISFKQNKVISSNIRGAMEIKKFIYPAGTINEAGEDISGDQVSIGVQGHLHDDGDFNLTASAVPPYPIELGGIFIYNMRIKS